MAVWSSLKAFLKLKPSRVPRVRAEEAQKLAAEGATVIDVREGFEFRRGHIPGARHIPLGEVESRAAEIPKDKPVVLHCALGARSTRAAAALAEQGYDVRDMNGGFVEWKKKGLPVEKEP